MATFRLRRCKLRDGWFVPKKDEQPLEVDWKGLCEMLAPSRSPESRRTLRAGVSANAYVGLIRQSNGAVTNFVIRNPDMTGDVRALAKRDPTFPVRLVDAFRIESAEWDSAMLEGTNHR
jgi:hypothetical protein